MSDGAMAVKNTYKNNERKEDKATSKRRDREMRRIKTNGIWIKENSK